MTEDAATCRELLATVAAGKPLEPHLVEWLRERLRPAAERRRERDELLRRAAALMAGVPWTKAGRIAELARKETRKPTAAPDLGTPAGCVAAAVAVYAGRPDRALSRRQALRIIAADIRPVEMSAAAVGGSDSERKPDPMSLDTMILDDARDKFLRGAAASIYQRAGLTDTLRAAQRVERLSDQLAGVAFDPGEFRGMRLADLARHALELRGVSVRNLHGDAIIQRALEYRGGMNTTSDFVVLLETAVNKIFLGRYATTPVTWPLWCGRKSVADFRTATFYRPGTFGDLDAVSEAGEIKQKNVPDGAKAQLTASTKGNIIGLTRKAIANDELGAFGDLALGLGEAAAFSVETDVFALLTANAGLGPTQTDTNPLFHSGRANIGTTGAMDVTTWDSAASVMAAQKDVSGTRVLDLSPAVWLGPTGLRLKARTLNASATDPAAPVSGGANPVRDMVRTICGTSRLPGTGGSTTRHYFFADPAAYPTFAVGFIDGNEAPRIESRQAFGFEGIQIKVTLDYGVAVLDYRGAVTCAGA